MSTLASTRAKTPTAKPAATTQRAACQCGQHDHAGSACTSCAERAGVIQRCAENGNPGCACGVDEVLRGPGQPLDPALRAEMEHRFGTDFSQVRVHTDANAAKTADRLNAQAYTVGRDIAFAAGRYQPRSQPGRRLLAHELTHVVQQRGMPAAPQRIGPHDDHHEREATRVAAGGTAPSPATAPAGLVQRQPTGPQTTASPANPRAVCFVPGTAVPAPGTCSAREPQACATFGQWLHSFDPLRTFSTQDVIPGGGLFTPLGDEPAARDPRDARQLLPGETPPGRLPATPVPPRSATVTDRFIDHPTDQWARMCLPDDLRDTAYMLPSDCADTAVILWHVWLFAHGRTARFGRWTCGVGAGRGTDRSGVGGVIDEVYSQNVSQMLTPYADAQGRPLRSFASLRHLIRPGDVLVWRHSGPGSSAPGHTQTVVDMQYSGANVTSIDVIQGNMPLGDDPAGSGQASQIRDRLRAEGQRHIPDTLTLRRAPGRRLEMTSLSGTRLRDGADPGAARGQAAPPDVWLLSSDTALVAAGPPKTARRPPGGGTRGARQLTDWAAPLGTAQDRETLLEVYEEALHEARALVDGGRTDDAGATALGVAAGEAVWRLARRAGGTGEASHFRFLLQLKAVLHALRDDQPDHPRRTELVRTFAVIEGALDAAARGLTNVQFPTRARRGTRLVRVLLTGFDPFAPAGPGGGPAPGAWNPSAAAALALDGEQINAGGNVVAAVETMVFPVDFRWFGQGFVEGAVGPRLGTVDAVLTVSMAGGETREGAIRFERFAVGVHDVPAGTAGVPAGLRDVPAFPGAGAGRPLLESIGPVDAVRGQVGRGAITAEVGNDVTLRFGSAAEAADVRRSLGLPAGPGPDVEVADAAAVRRIAATASLTAGSARITFTDPSGRPRTATLVSGPGGNFLSNEVSYRVLRMIAALPAGQRPISFHTHTPQGLVVDPANPGGAEARSRRVLANVIEALRRTVAATAQQVVQQRRAGGRP